MPGMTLVEPSCEEEVGKLLEWCINDAPGSSYIRLCSLPWNLPYELPVDYIPRVGQGATLVEGVDVAVIAYGPVLLNAAVEGSKMAAKAKGVSVKVINLPWLNRVDIEWLRSALAGCQKVVALDNHYQIGGQGELIAKAVAQAGMSIVFEHCGVTDIPPSGTNLQVLDAVGLDSEAIVKVILR
jgi:transketolase